MGTIMLIIAGVLIIGAIVVSVMHYGVDKSPSIMGGGYDKKLKDADPEAGRDKHPRL